MDMSVSEGEEEPEADSHGSPRNRKFLLTPSKKKKKKKDSAVMSEMWADSWSASLRDLNSNI